MPAIDPWLTEHLVCPRDHGPLTDTGRALVCPSGHEYPVVDGVPVMLVDDVPQTFAAATSSLSRAAGDHGDHRAPELFLESVSISDEEKAGVLELAVRRPAIDPVVSYLIAATNGLAYKHLRGALTQYPIPDIQVPPAHSRRLLDIGCSWGRWALAAQAKGYQAVGIDPSLGAVMAARRVARQLGVANRYLVGDARYLPFPPRSFDVTYSYSVLQHMSPSDVSLAVGEMGRVLTTGGHAKVQMPAAFGVRCLYHQARRGFRSAREFEVRYWTIPALVRLFERHIGTTRVDVDCYFGLGLQPSDEPLMTPGLRRILRASERLRAASRKWSALTWVADSVFVEAESRA